MRVSRSLRHRWVRATATAVLGTWVAAVGAAQEIKIGALMPFSGPATSWGISMAGAIEMAAEEVQGDRHPV